MKREILKYLSFLIILEAILEFEEKEVWYVYDTSKW